MSITTRLILGSSVTLFALLAPCSITLAQTHQGSHHHLIIGIDNLETLTSGTYIGLPNPNYQRLSLLFPHQHIPVEVSHFHAIGVYSYTGDVSNPVVVSTSTNNVLPEARYNLPPMPLFPGTGVFSGQRISRQTDNHLYSDLRTRPVAHLVEDLDDPYVAAIYNTGNGRWNDLLGDEATIALELVSITPGLGVANSQGQDLFNAVGDTYVIGTGDYFSFTPTVYLDDDAPRGTYSATFRFLDVNTANGRTPLLSSGTFSLNFTQTPEPSTLLGLGVLGLLAFVNRHKNEVN